MGLVFLCLFLGGDASLQQAFNVRPSFVTEAGAGMYPECTNGCCLPWLSLWPLTSGWFWESREHPAWEDVRLGITLTWPFLLWLSFSLRDALAFALSTCRVLDSKVVWPSDTGLSVPGTLWNRGLSVLFILRVYCGRLISPCLKRMLITIDFPGFVIIRFLH